MGEPKNGKRILHYAASWLGRATLEIQPGKVFYKENDMHIHKFISQDRRDFVAIYICEHCDHRKESMGYDDANYHLNVIPNFECPKCHKTAGENYRPLTTKYPEGMQI